MLILEILPVLLNLNLQIWGDVSHNMPQKSEFLDSDVKQQPAWFRHDYDSMGFEARIVFF